LRSELRTAVPEDVIWLVAEVAGEAVGDARARLYDPSPETALESRRDVGRRRAYLEWIAVQARYRRQGLGGRLLQAVEERARECGAELINLGTNLRSDFGAVGFFEKHGYEKQAVIL